MFIRSATGGSRLRACGGALPSYFDMFENAELQPRSLQVRAAPARDGRTRRERNC